MASIFSSLLGFRSNPITTKLLFHQYRTDSYFLERTSSMKRDRKDHINHSCKTGSQLFNHNVEDVFSRRSRKMWYVSSSDGWHLPPARELDGWPTGYIRKTALKLRSSPSLWFVRLNTWWVFSSHDVLPPLNSVIESFYVSVRVNFPLAGVCLFCAVTSLTVAFVKYTHGWKSQELEDALCKGVQSQCI